MNLPETGNVFETYLLSAKETPLVHPKNFPIQIVRLEKILFTKKRLASFLIRFQFLKASFLD